MVNQLQTYMATFLHNMTAEHISIDEKEPSMSTSNVSPLSGVTTVTLNFNEKVVNDQRVRCVVLPIGDGVTMIQLA